MQGEDSWPRSLRSRSSLGVTGTSRNDALPGEGEGVGKKRPSGQVAGTDQPGDNEWLKEAVSVRVGEGEEVVRKEEATERNGERCGIAREAQGVAAAQTAPAVVEGAPVGGGGAAPQADPGRDREMKAIDGWASGGGRGRSSTPWGCCSCHGDGG